ncbi:MAG: hypothetical protein ACLQNE_16955, partial [Thermoguttaceae bacterium]
GLAKRSGQTETEVARFAAQEQSLKVQQEACRQERAKLEAEDAARREEFARRQQQWEADRAQWDGRRDVLQGEAAERAKAIEVQQEDLARLQKAWEKDRLEQERRLAERADQVKAEAARITAENDHLAADRAAWRQKECGLDAERTAAREDLARRQEAWEQERQQQEGRLAQRARQVEAKAAKVAAELNNLQAAQEALRQERNRIEAEKAERLACAGGSAGSGHPSVQSDEDGGAVEEIPGESAAEQYDIQNPLEILRRNFQEEPPKQWRMAVRNPTVLVTVGTAGLLLLGVIVWALHVLK